jgi:hypothetical protein
MSPEVWQGALAGAAIGLFLALGSAYVIGKSLKFMNDPNASMVMAIGLGSIWITKLIAACAAIYLAQKAGLSTTALGVSLPIGIVLGVLAVKSRFRGKT